MRRGGSLVTRQAKRKRCSSALWDQSSARAVDRHQSMMAVPRRDEHSCRTAIVPESIREESP